MRVQRRPERTWRDRVRERELVVIDGVDVDGLGAAEHQAGDDRLVDVAGHRTRWPGCVAATTAIWTLSVEPLVENIASPAPNAAAARSCAWAMIP
jgi:hypothetical protein